MLLRSLHFLQAFFFSDEQKLYAWLMEKYLDLYSIDSTWEDLDSTSKDSLTKIAQLDSYAGSMAGSVAEVLGIGRAEWFYPDFDTSFVLPDVEDTLEEEEEREERWANSGNEFSSPGLQNINIDAGGFSLYPSPTNGNFISENKENGYLAVFSLDGKLIAGYEVKNGKNNLQLPKGLAPGVYLAQYKSNNGTQTVNKKIVYQP